MTEPREPNPFVTVGVWLALWWSSVALATMLVQPRLATPVIQPEAPGRSRRPALRVIEGGQR